jgi:hypothetical protein
MAKKAKASKTAKQTAKKKAKKLKLEIFDPFGPGFRVFHKQGAASTHVGGSTELADDTQTGDKLTLEIFDPLGPGFRVFKKGGG